MPNPQTGESMTVVSSGTWEKISDSELKGTYTNPFTQTEDELKLTRDGSYLTMLMDFTLGSMSLTDVKLYLTKQ